MNYKEHQRGGRMKSARSKFKALTDLTHQAFQLRSNDCYALHPVETTLQYHRAETGSPGEEGHGGFGFEQAEAHYRAGAQGLRLS